MNKYKHIYENQKDYGNYGHQSHGERFKSILLSYKPVSLLDVGCGHNEFVKSSGLGKAIGVDIACPSADVISPANKMPFYDKEFDWITSFDTLEHLEPCDVNASLKEMSRVSDNYIMTVCFKHETCYRVDGETLHPSANDFDWWTKKLSEYSNIKETILYAEPSLNDHCCFIGEWK